MHTDARTHAHKHIHKRARILSNKIYFVSVPNAFSENICIYFFFICILFTCDGLETLYLGVTPIENYKIIYL